MKKGLIAIIVIIILVIIAILLLRGCEPRKKPQEETPTEETSDDVAETESETNSETDYHSAFVKANTEFTCAIVTSPELAENEEELIIALDEAYEKNGFPIDDNERMFEILSQYENDQEAINEIQQNVKECQEALNL